MEVQILPGELMFKTWYRWLFRNCMDCGIKLDKSYNRGDVCQKCFNDFDGLTIEELIGEENF